MERTKLPKPTGPNKAGIWTWLDFKFQPAPNRFRRLHKDGQTEVEYWHARAESVRMQRAQFSVRGYDPVGLELSPWNFDEILVWVKKIKTEPYDRWVEFDPKWEFVNAIIEARGRRKRTKKPTTA